MKEQKREKGKGQEGEEGGGAVEEEEEGKG